MESSVAIVQGDRLSGWYSGGDFERQGIFPGSDISTEIALNILSYLKTSDLVLAYLVSKEWCFLAGDVELQLKRFEHLFGERLDGALWNKRLNLEHWQLSIKEEPKACRAVDGPTLEKVLVIFKKNALLFYATERKFIWLTVPQGLTINKFVRLANVTLRNKKVSLIKKMDPEILNKFGEVAVEKTYKILITDQSFPRSKQLTCSAQQKVLQDNSCRMPKLIEMMALLILTRIHSGKYLFIEQTLYSRCEEQIADGKHVIVGNSNPYEGFEVTFLSDAVESPIVGSAAVVLEST